MKVITLRQPWASMLASGVMPYETRSWSPPTSLFGQRVAIHSAKRPIAKAELSTAMTALMEEEAEQLAAGHCNPPNHWPYGTVLATATLAGAALIEAHAPGKVAACTLLKPDGTWQEYPFCVDIKPTADYSIGKFIWVLTDTHPLEKPITASGQRGLWDWDAPARAGAAT